MQPSLGRASWAATGAVGPPARGHRARGRLQGLCDAHRGAPRPRNDWPSGPAWAALAGRFGQALEVWPGGHPELEQSAAMRLVQARLAQAPPTGEPDLR